MLLSHLRVHLPLPSLLPSPLLAVTQPPPDVAQGPKVPPAVKLSSTPPLLTKGPPVSMGFVSEQIPADVHISIWTEFNLLQLPEGNWASDHCSPSPCTANTCMFHSSAEHTWLQVSVCTGGNGSDAAIAVSRDLRMTDVPNTPSSFLPSLLINAF